MRGASGQRGSASSGIRTRGCSTCTPTSHRCTRRPEHTSRCSRSTTSSPASSRPTPTTIERKETEIRDVFDLADAGTDPIAAEITPDVFDWSARVAVGLDRLVEDFELDALTYYYRGVGDNVAERVSSGLIVGNSLLTARGVPAAGEGDLKTNVAMLLLDRLDAGGSYTEFYGLDFDEGFVLMGHDGPGHLGIADGRPVARALGLYHGKAGAGLSIEMKVRLGPVTILGLTQTVDGRLKLLAAEGESIAGPTFRIGNTNSRIRFSGDPAAFFDDWCAEGPTHHVALGIGHQVARIRKVAHLLGSRSHRRPMSARSTGE